MIERTEYLHLKPDTALPHIAALPPFRAVVIVEANVAPEWQSLVSNWLVRSGCLYMMAWGDNRSSWDDSVDIANIEQFNFESIPEDKFVFTTWHTNEPLEEVFWYSKNNAVHPAVKLERTLLVHIFVKQRAILSRLEVKTASNSFHLSVSPSGAFAGGNWSVLHGHDLRNSQEAFSTKANGQRDCQRDGAFSAHGTQIPQYC